MKKLILAVSVALVSISSFANTEFVNTNQAPYWKCENNQMLVYIAQNDTGLELIATNISAASFTVGNLFYGALEKKDIMSDTTYSTTRALSTAQEAHTLSTSGEQLAKLNIIKGEFSLHDPVTDEETFKSLELECNYFTK